MKSYYSQIAKSSIIAAAVLTCMLVSCTPGRIVSGKLELFEKKIYLDSLADSRLAVIPFTNPESSREFGHYVAREFAVRIAQMRRLKDTVILETTPWLWQNNSHDIRFKKALMEARRNSSDFLLLGNVQKYSDGQFDTTGVLIDCRLVNTATGEILWWGRKRVTGRRGRSHLFWGSHTSPPAPQMRKCIARAADKIVADMFPKEKVEKASDDSASNVSAFFNKVKKSASDIASHFFSKDRTVRKNSSDNQTMSDTMSEQPPAETEPPLSVQTDDIPPATDAVPPESPGTREDFPRSMPPDGDILDSALDELTAPEQ